MDYYDVICFLNVFIKNIFTINKLNNKIKLVNTIMYKEIIS